MNVWQGLKQARKLALARLWQGSGEVVFQAQSVVVSAAIDEDVLKNLVSPIVTLRPMDGQSDPDHREEASLIHTTVKARIIVAVANDAQGQAPLIGGGRGGAASFGQNSSKGRGILEVETELRAAIQDLNDIDGIRVLLDAQSASAADLDQNLRYIAARDIEFVFIGSAELFYHPARNFVGTAPGGGAASLSWALPPTSRYDFLKVKVRRAAGATPPATKDSGTAVTETASGTSFSDSPGAGTFSYSIFGVYDETNPTPTQEQRASAAATITSLVVT